MQEGRRRLVFRHDRPWVELVRNPEHDLMVRLGAMPASSGDWAVTAAFATIALLVVAAVAAGDAWRGAVSAALYAVLGLYMLVAGWSRQRSGWSHRDRWPLLGGEVLVVTAVVMAVIATARAVGG